MFKLDHMSVEELLGNKRSYYKIPDYQRSYSWETEHVNKLWDDLYEAWDLDRGKDSDDNAYFLGSIVLTGSDKEDRYDVIDGQQRLITLIIFFCTLRDLIKGEKLTLAADSDSASISQKDIEDLISSGDKNRVTLVSQIKEHTTFLSDIIGKVDIDAKRMNKKERLQNKFCNTAQVFINNFIDDNVGDRFFENDEEIAEFICYILKKVTVITIICENRSAAIRIFQTLNARGLNLSTANLIRSYLFGCVSPDKPEDRETLDYEWNKMESHIKENNDITVENLLLYYAYFLYKGNIDKELYEALISRDKAFYKQASDSPTNALSNIASFAAQYDTIRNSYNKDIHSLLYLRQQIYWRTILISAAYKKEELKESTIDWEDLATSLMRFYYLYWIAGHNINKIKHFSFSLIKHVIEGKDLTYINQQLEKKLTDDRVIDKVWEEIRSDYCYQNTWCKPLLIAIETGMYDDDLSFDHRERNSKIHVEHILPQNYRKNINSWQSITEHENKLHSLPNLTLLSGKKNVAASDKPFGDKLKANYLDKEGKGEDGITGFGITRQLKDYEKKGWTDETYKLRKEWLEEQIKKLLNI